MGFPKPSFSGDCAKRSAAGDFERSMRLLRGRGGIRGTEALLEPSLSELLEGRGGTAGIGCVAADMFVVEFNGLKGRESLESVGVLEKH